MLKKLIHLYHQLSSPKFFYFMSERILMPFMGIVVLILTVGLVGGLFFAPADYQQGDSFRIIYIHVPAAMLAQTAYIMMAVLSVIYWVWKIKLSAWMARSIAPIGASFCFIALFTGAVWGKPTWGTWWVWDARLTSMLILFFLYLGVMALHSSIEKEAVATRVASLLTVVGVVNIPIIKYSVNWWHTLHQPATLTLTHKPTMPIEMLWPLLTTIVGFYGLFLWLVLLRVRNEIIEKESHKQWFFKS